MRVCVLVWRCKVNVNDLVVDRLVILILFVFFFLFVLIEGETAEQTAAGRILTSVKSRLLLHLDAFSHIEHLTECTN